MPGPRLSWSWGCLGAAGQHWGSSWGRIHSWPPVLAGQAAANSCQSWSRGTHSSAAPPLAFISQGNSQGKRHTAPHRPLAPHLLKVRHGERLVAPRYEFPEVVTMGACPDGLQERGGSSCPRVPGQE